MQTQGSELGDFTSILRECSRSAAEFRENLLKHLAPEGSTEETIAFLKENNVHFVTLLDGREELHGFGKKLGILSSGPEPQEDGSLLFVNRFTACD